jgi:hypothetical protein
LVDEIIEAKAEQKSDDETIEAVKVRKLRKKNKRPQSLLQTNSLQES